jgi:SAM-dependent methyltransferase
MFAVTLLALEVIFLAGLLVAGVVFLIAAQRNVVPPVFTPRGAVDEVIEALELPERGLLVDVGCGDGRLLADAVKLRPGLRAVGVENNPVVWCVARWRLGRRAKVVLGQIENMELTGADRVFAYLGPGLMAELEPRFERELSKGALVVSQQFPLPHRTPNRVVKLKHGKVFAKELFIYEY